MNRYRSAVARILLLLVVPLALSFSTWGDEGSVKTTTRFLPKPEDAALPIAPVGGDESIEAMLETVEPGEPEIVDDPLAGLDPGAGLPATSPQWQDVTEKDDEPQSPSMIVRIWIAHDEGEPQTPALTAQGDADPTPPGLAPPQVVAPPIDPFFDIGATDTPLAGMNPVLWPPLRYVNAAVDRILAHLEGDGWYTALRSDVQTVSAQFERYIRGQTINGRNAGTIVDALNELRAAVADLRAIAKDDKAIAELYEKAQPNNPDACPSTNRGCQAIRRIARVLKDWATIAGASGDSETTSALHEKLTGIFTDFFTRTGATSRWMADRARDLEDIHNRILSTTQPVDGTDISFADWRSKVGLVEENLRWTLDHSGEAKSLSAVSFGLEMAKDFKEDLEKTHQTE